MEKLTVLILVEGEEKPIVGEWIDDTDKAECVRVQGQDLWFPKSACMGGLRSKFWSDENAAVVDEYIADHQEEMRHIYVLRVPIWLANEKEIPGFDEEIPENVTVVGQASKGSDEEYKIAVAQRRKEFSVCACVDARGRIPDTLRGVVRIHKDFGNTWIRPCDLETAIECVHMNSIDPHRSIAVREDFAKAEKLLLSQRGL